MSKKIVIQKIEIENFLSFKDKQVLSFNKNGIHLIKGENRDASKDIFSDEITQTNSAGKSSIGKAIDFALFGENPNKKIKIDSLINKKIKKNLEVCLDFSIDNKQYRVERYRKYSGKGSGLSLYKINDDNTVEDLSFADVKLTQERINDILSLNHDTFLYSILITKESGLNFIELPWYQRSLLLENIVRLDKLREYTKKVKDQMSKDRKEFDFYEKEYYAKNSTLDVLNNSIKRNIKVKRDLIVNNKKNLDLLNKDLDILLKGSNLNELESFVEYVKKSNFIDKSTKESVKIKSKIKTSLIKINNLKKDIVKLNQNYSCDEEQCSHCDKKIKKGKDSNLEYSISLSKDTLKDLKISLKEDIKKIKILLKEISNLKKEVFGLTFSLDKEIKKIIIDEILNGGSGLSHFKNLESIKDEIQKLKSFKIDTSDISHLRSNIKEIKKEKEICNTKIKELEHQLKIGEFWDSSLDFRNEGSLKNYIMAKIVPVFNSFLGSLIDIIFEGSMTIAFDNSWNETIIYHGDEYDYNQLSLGEKAKINFCISLSLFSLMRINVGGTSLIFLDEIFSSIDESGIKKFIEILRTSFSKDIAVYVISHEKGILNVSFDSVLTIIKENEQSRIKINQAL